MKQKLLNLYTWRVASLTAFLSIVICGHVQAQEVLFAETFGESTSSIVWNNSYSVKSGIAEVYDNVEYEIPSTTTKLYKSSSSSSYPKTGSCLYSLKTQTGSFTLGPLNVANYSEILVNHWACASGATDFTTAYVKLSYSTSGEENSYKLVKEYSGLSVKPMIKYTYVLPAESFSSTLYLKFEFYGGSGNSFAYFDDLEITAGMPTVSLNSFGYATYASDMAIDFTNSEGYTAWQITGVSGETINFQKITGAVAGCTGMLLMGDPSSDVKITLANSGETLSDNLLVGSTENKPLAITGGGNYYGLVGKEFVEVSRGNGTLPAGKAVLPADAVKGSVKSLNLVFNDETGIREVRTVSVEEAAEIFNLAGQRLQKAQKGVNIVNGKKVLIQR